MSTLAERLRTNAERLTQRVLDEMYQDPFWQDRYAARADQHGRQDGKFHVDYLCEALAANDPAVMQRYAAWLQDVLVTRGMCSRHLAENFLLLGRAILDEGWPDGEEAVVILRLATEALRHEDPAALAIQEHETQIAQHAVAALAADATVVGMDAAALHHEIGYLVDYAADAVALATPSIVQKRALWAEDFHGRHDRSLPRAATLAALRAAIGDSLPDHRSTIALIFN